MSWNCKRFAKWFALVVVLVILPITASLAQFDGIIQNLMGAAIQQGMAQQRQYQQRYYQVPQRPPQYSQQTPQFGAGPSFDCRGHRSTIEQAICGDPELSQLDRVMADAFIAKMRQGSDLAELKAGQAQWRSQRDACTTRACLKEAMISRTAQLSGSTGETFQQPSTALAGDDVQGDPPYAGLEMPQLPQLNHEPLLGGGGSQREEIKWVLLAELAVDPGQIDRNPEGFASYFLSSHNPLANTSAWHSSNEFHTTDARQAFMAQYAPALKKAALRLPTRFMFVQPLRFEQYDRDRQGFVLDNRQDGVPRPFSAANVPFSGNVSFPNDFWPIREARARALFDKSRDLSSHNVSLATEIEIGPDPEQPDTLSGRWVHAYLLDPGTKQVVYDFGAAPDQAVTAQADPGISRSSAVSPSGANPFAAWTHPPAGFKQWRFSTLDGAVAFSDTKLLMLFLAAANKPDFSAQNGAYFKRYYLEQAMLDGPTLDSVYSAGANLRGLNEFEKSRSAAKVETIFQTLVTLAPHLPLDVTLTHQAFVPEYNMAKGGFALGTADDFGLRHSAEESGLALSTSFAWPDIFWPIDPTSAESVWKSLGSNRMVQVAGHVTIESIEPSTGRVKVRLHSVSLYKVGTQKLLYRFPIDNDAPSQSEEATRLSARKPVPLDQLFLCAERLNIGDPVDDRTVAACRTRLVQKDAATYANPALLATLSRTDPDYPFFPRNGPPPNIDTTAMLREWAKAYVAAAVSKPITYSNSRIYARATGGMAYQAVGRAESSTGSQWSRLLEKLQLRPEQITSTDPLDDTPVIFILPNIASSYDLFVPDSELNHDSDGAATPVTSLRFESAQMVQDNTGKTYLTLRVSPVGIVVTHRVGGGVIASRSFSDVQSFGQPPSHKDDKAVVPFDSALIDLLVAKSSGPSLPQEAVAYMIKRRWEYERAENGVIDRYFQIGRPAPNVDAIQAQISDFVTWAAAHAPSLPLKIRLQTAGDMSKDQTMVLWRSFPCIEDGTSNLKANDYAARANYERLQCERQRRNGTSEEVADCDATDVLLAKSELLHEIGGVCRRRDLTFNFIDPLSVFAHFDKQVPAPLIKALGGKETIKIGAILTLASVSGSNEDPREALFANAPASIRVDGHTVDAHYFENLEFKLGDVTYTDARTGAALQARIDDHSDEVKAPEQAAPKPEQVAPKPQTVPVAGGGMDLIGIRIGMPFDAAEAIIRDHMKVGSVLQGERAFDEQAKRGFIKPMTSGKLFVSDDGREMIALIDEPPAASQQVLAAWRRVYSPDGNIPPEDIMAGLKQKYGEPLQGASELSGSAHWSTRDGRQCYAFYGATHTDQLADIWDDEDGRPAQLKSSNPRGMNSVSLADALFDPLNPRYVQWRKCGPYVTASYLQSRGLSGPMDELDMTLTDFGRYVDAFSASRQQLQQQNPDAAAQAHIKF